jgi:hypothetical protein
VAASSRTMTTSRPAPNGRTPRRLDYGSGRYYAVQQFVGDEVGSEVAAVPSLSQARRQWWSRRPGSNRRHLAYKICACRPPASVGVRGLGQPFTAVAAYPASSAPVAVGVVRHAAAFHHSPLARSPDLRITSRHRHRRSGRAGDHQMTQLIQRCPLAFIGWAARLAASCDTRFRMKE